jgi:hypothetical protein
MRQGEDVMRARQTATIAIVLATLFAIVVLHPARLAPASTSVPGAIEYKVVKLAPQFAGNTEAILNQMGAQGWDIAYGVGEYILMKRSKQPGP